jgi:hypothetical protein
MKCFEFRIAMKDACAEIQDTTAIGEITHVGGHAQAFRVTR